MKTCRVARSLFPLFCAVSLLSGCASFGGSVGDLLGPEPDMAKKDTSVPKDVPHFVVEMRPNGKSAERYKLPLSDDATYVAQVLEKSRAVKRFGRVTIELWRPLASGGHHKLDVLFDRKERVVRPGYDYEIRPGDRLVLIEDTTTVFDDMFDSVLGPATAVLR